MVLSILAIILAVVALILILIFNSIRIKMEQDYQKIIDSYKSGEAYKDIIEENKKLKSENKYLKTMIFVYEHEEV